MEFNRSLKKVRAQQKALKSAFRSVYPITYQSDLEKEDERKKDGKFLVLRLMMEAVHTHNRPDASSKNGYPNQCRFGYTILLRPVFPTLLGLTMWTILLRAMLIHPVHDECNEIDKQGIGSYHDRPRNILFECYQCVWKGHSNVRATSTVSKASSMSPSTISL